MTEETAFSHAAFQHWLEHVDGLDVSAPAMSPALAAIIVSSDGHAGRTSAAHSLSLLLMALREQQSAALNVERVADALRRYQKFAKPGQPSTHIVQLRQQQGATRQAASVAKQQFIKHAAAFVRDAGIDVPERVALELFITRWITVHVPVG